MRNLLLYYILKFPTLMAQGLKSVREAVKPLLQGSLRYTSNEVAEQICRSLKISLSATFSWVFASFVCAYPLHVSQVPVPCAPF